MKFKKIIITVLSGLMCVSVTTHDLPIGYWNIAVSYKYLTFATDEGSFIKALKKPISEYVSLEDYVPIKEDYIFNGWYLDARTKKNRVYEVTLNENVVIYAKWLDDGLPKPQKPEPTKLTVEQALAHGNYRDVKTGVPITRLWVQQNTRLQELMAQYNAKFNN